jgi:hypothetical protein
MRHISASLLLALLLVSICSSGHAATPPAGESVLQILSFTTDKDIYSAKEEMTLNLAIHAPQALS